MPEDGHYTDDIEFVAGDDRVWTAQLPEPRSPREWLWQIR